MLRNIFIGLLLFISHFAYSQGFSLGGKIGINYSKLSMDKVSTNIGTVATEFRENSQYATGFIAGGFARVKLAGFYVQPELYFNLKGGTFDKYVTTGGIAGNINELSQIDVKTYGFDIPILLGYQISMFRFNLGPVASFNISSLDAFKTAIANSTASSQIVSDAVKTAVWGYQVGVGVDISKFTADLRYEGNFSALTSAGLVSGSNLSQKTGVFQLSVGYKFL